MSLEMLVYLFDVLSNLSVVLVLTGLALLLASVFNLLRYGVADDERIGRPKAEGAALVEAIQKSAIKHAKLFGAGAVALFLLTALIPSQRTMYTMAAVSLTKDAARSEIGQKLIKRAEEWALEYLEPKKKEAK